MGVMERIEYAWEKLCYWVAEMRLKDSEPEDTLPYFFPKKVWAETRVWKCDGEEQRTVVLRFKGWPEDGPDVTDLTIEELCDAVIEYQRALSRIYEV